MGIVVCDDLLRFARRQSGAPIRDSEESPGTVLEKAAVTIRYGSKEEALVAVDTASTANRDSSTFSRFQTSRMKAKTTRQLFDTEQLVTNQYGSGNDLPEEISNDDANVETIRNWLALHREVKPLVRIQCKRTRFFGLRNCDKGGFWATLDRDCSMKKWPNYSSSADKSLTFNDADDEGLEEFPFALLEVRFEGDVGTDFISALDETHLVGVSFQNLLQSILFTSNRLKEFEASPLRLTQLQRFASQSAWPLPSG